MNEVVSEVARLRQQIEIECQSLKHFTEYAVTSKHAIIAAQHDKLGAAQDNLAGLVGDKEAIRVVAEIYIQTMG